MTPIATYAADALYWVFIGIFVVNLTQRRYQEAARRKRFATLYLGIAGFALFLVAQTIEVIPGRDWMLVPGFGAVFGIVYYYRQHTWPFIIRCPGEKKLLTWHKILYEDDPCSEEPGFESADYSNGSDDSDDPSET